MDDGVYLDAATVLTEGKVMITVCDGELWRQIMKLEDWLILADGSNVVVLSEPPSPYIVARTIAGRAAAAAEEAAEALVAATAAPSDALAAMAFMKANVAEDMAKAAFEAASVAQKVVCKFWAAQATKNLEPYPYNPGFLVPSRRPSAVARAAAATAAAAAARVAASAFLGPVKIE